MTDAQKAAPPVQAPHVRLRESGMSRTAIKAVLELIESEDARDAARDYLNPPKPKAVKAEAESEEE